MRLLAEERRQAEILAVLGTAALKTEAACDGWFSGTGCLV